MKGITREAFYHQPRVAMGSGTVLPKTANRCSGTLRLPGFPPREHAGSICFSGMDSPREVIADMMDTMPHKRDPGEPSSVASIRDEGKGMDVEIDLSSTVRSAFEGLVSLGKEADACSLLIYGPWGPAKPPCSISSVKKSCRDKEVVAVATGASVGVGLDAAVVAQCALQHG
jgi:hypothetical protein